MFLSQRLSLGTMDSFIPFLHFSMNAWHLPGKKIIMRRKYSSLQHMHRCSILLCLTTRNLLMTTRGGYKDGVKFYQISKNCCSLCHRSACGQTYLVADVSYISKDINCSLKHLPKLFVFILGNVSVYFLVCQQLSVCSARPVSHLDSGLVDQN